MAFDRTKLSGNMGAGSSAPKLFTFGDTASTMAQIAATDYFLAVYQILAVGDVIQATGSDGTTNLAVTASSSTTVTTGDVVPAGGATGSFISDAAASTVTVTNGIITAIV